MLRVWGPWFRLKGLSLRSLWGKGARAVQDHCMISHRILGGTFFEADGLARTRESKPQKVVDLKSYNPKPEADPMKPCLRRASVRVETRDPIPRAGASPCKALQIPEKCSQRPEPLLPACSSSMSWTLFMVQLAVDSSCGSIRCVLFQVSDSVFESEEPGSQILNPKDSL